MDKETKQAFEKIDERFESLAVMVKRGFDGVYEIMDKRFDAVDKHFDKIEADIVDIKEEIRQMRIEIRQVWNKLEEIEQKLEKVSRMAKEDADALGGEFLDLRHRVEFLENKFKELQTA